MTQLDRLSALMMHFALDVEPAPAEAAQLFVVAGEEGRRVMLTPRAPGECRAGPAIKCCSLRGSIGAGP